MQWLFLILSFVPAALLVVGWAFLPSGEAWGELFTLLVVSCAMSAVLIASGIVWARVRRRSHESAAVLITATLVASLPILLYGFWFLLHTL
jgi:hypothetical protein